MSLVQPIPASGALAVRTEAAPPQAMGGRDAPPASRAETARAALPPESAARVLRNRFEDRDGRPAGPPPAFQVSMLQVIREAALDPAFESEYRAVAMPPTNPAPEADPARFDLRF